MSYRDEHEALRARVEMLERRAQRVERLEQRIVELERENARLRDAADASVPPTPKSSTVAAHANIYVDAKVVAYIEALLAACRDRSAVEGLLSGPQTDAQSIVDAAKEQAASSERAYVTPEDVKIASRRLLVEGILLTEAALKRGNSASSTLDAILAAVPVP